MRLLRLTHSLSLRSLLPAALTSCALLGCSAGGTGTGDGTEGGDGDGDTLGDGDAGNTTGGNAGTNSSGGAGQATGGSTNGVGGSPGSTGGAGTGGSDAGSSGGETSGETCTPGGTDFDQQADHVIDLSTCVYYQRAATVQAHPPSLPHADAIAACEALSLAGFDDWRLPTVAELTAIVDTTVQLQPSVDPTLFPDALGSMYWTSMTSSGKVTTLDFYNSGSVNNNIGPDGAQAYRCVRAAL